jgi:predicted enzyme related to lactoylglutathione lyase
LAGVKLNQVTLPAIDVAVSVAFYKVLGLTLIVDALPRYARLELPDGASTLSLHQVPARPADGGVVIYLECEDLDREVERLESAGIAFTRGPQDEPWLWREARLRDPSNNEVCLYRAGENRRFPPWRVRGAE